MNSKRIIMMSMIGLGLIAAWAAAKQAPTPPPIIIKNEQGEQAQLYQKSYALLIGVSDYENWPSLPDVKNDIAEVAAVLTEHGFLVKTVMNPRDYAALDQAFRNFINDEHIGQARENRLLFYFAGHGATLKRDGQGDMGYLVAAAAPLIRDDRAGFLRNALDMETIAGYAKNLAAKHALFIFDSCFAGSIFDMTRGVPEEITYKAAQPVRQFITSGSKDQTVPAVSIFRPLLVDALRGSGDYDQDGYITGSELGYVLDKRVVKSSRGQYTPQYGKLNDVNFDEGDFVFQLPQQARPTPAPTPPPTDFSLDDVMPEAWQDYADKMAAAFAQVREYDAQPRRAAAAKAAAWQKFVTAFAADNIYDTQDEEMRQYAAQRIADLRQPTPRPSQEGNTHPTPSQEGNTELPSSEGPGVGSCWESETPGATCAEPTTGMEFVYVPGGCFQMGSNDGDSDEKPVHEVCLQGFWMGKYEVTQAQWQAVMGRNPSSFKGADRPVETVSWNDAQAFLKKLNAASVGALHVTPLQFRLPSEAEWEYAARAGTQTAYSFGDDPNQLGKYAWYGYENNAGKQTHPVGQKQPNAFGLYDMHGNVWEWVADTWHVNYNGAPTDGSAWSGGSNRVLRGGSWYRGPRLVRSADRSYSDPAGRGGDFGFRVARTK